MDVNPEDGRVSSVAKILGGEPGCYFREISQLFGLIPSAGHR